MPSGAPHILAIEDGDEDFDLLCHAFRACGISTPLVQCRGAREALQILGEGRDCNVQLPCLILLDLNLPDIDGRELLALLRNTAAADTTPILVLTTSNNPQDVRLCYARGANGYLVKPLGIARLRAMTLAFKHFWLEAAELPT